MPYHILWQYYNMGNGCSEDFLLYAMTKPNIEDARTLGGQYNARSHYSLGVVD